MNWKEVSFVLRGRVRLNVLKSLDNPKTATIIAKELSTHRSTVSRILGILEANHLVNCLDENEPYNRYYQRTKKGEQVFEATKKIQNP